jgi:hypothetical protein
MTAEDDRRAAELRAQGKSWREIAEEIEGPTAPDDGPTPEERAYAQGAAALRGGAFPPGAEPALPAQREALKVFHAAHNAGARREEAFDAGIKALFARAAKGDPTAVSKRTDGISEWIARGGGQ